MSQQALKTPPILMDEVSYGVWKPDPQIWEIFIDLAVCIKKKL